MTDKYPAVRLALVLVLGGTLAAGVMLTGFACQTPPGERSADLSAIGSRVGVESSYAQVAFNHEQHQAAVDNECTTCHHTKPNAAEQACYTCHRRDEGRFSKNFAAFVPKLKEVMHNPDTGCRACHDETTDDDLWDCSQCHTR